VKPMIHENFGYSNTARFDTGSLIVQKINGSDDGTFEIYDTAQPAFSATASHKFNQPFMFPAASATFIPDIDEQVQWSSAQRVNSTNLMAAIPPQGIQGFGIVQAGDGVNGNLASAIFSFDTTPGNLETVILSGNNASNDNAAPNVITIFGSSNTLRFGNSLGVDTKFSVVIWYTTGALV